MMLHDPGCNETVLYAHINDCEGLRLRGMGNRLRVTLWNGTLEV